MKNSKRFISLLILCLLMTSLSACTNADNGLASSNDTQQEQKTITVHGTSSITATPTIAYVNIGVTTFNKDAAIAQSENATKMDLVFKALENLGIAKEKIKTISYNISQHYDYSYSSSEMTGYDVTNMIQVTVVDLAKVSQVIDMTVDQGVNQANSISFSITEEENSKFYLQALGDAVANAKAKAEALAKAAGVSISEPSKIAEDSQSNVYPIYDASGMEKAADSATPISVGELKIEAGVTVVYDY